MYEHHAYHAQSSCSYWGPKIYRTSSNLRIDRPSPVSLMKARKNAQEIKGMKECHYRDGAAMAEFFAELQEDLCAGMEITEVDIDHRCCQHRVGM